MSRSRPPATAVPAFATLLPALVAWLLPLGAAHAFPDYTGSRSLGMGGGGRADARGNLGPLLNPSGMSLARLYTLDAGYQLVTRDVGHLLHLSVMDSTSAWRLAGGAYYTYRRATPAGLPNLGGHEAGVALSFPLTERVMIGATAKYLYVSGGAPEADGSAKHQGFTVDAGLTVRPVPILTIGVVGHNLRDLDTAQAPVALGYGVAVAAGSILTVVADGMHDFTPGDDTRGVRFSVGGGGEVTLSQRVVLRAGGGRDGRIQHTYLTAGLAAVSDLGAADFGFRQDVSGDNKLTYLAVGLRLFVPQP